MMSYQLGIVRLSYTERGKFTVLGKGGAYVCVECFSSAACEGSG